MISTKTLEHIGIEIIKIVSKFWKHCCCVDAYKLRPATATEKLKRARGD